MKIVTRDKSTVNYKDKNGRVSRKECVDFNKRQKKYIRELKKQIKDLEKEGKAICWKCYKILPLKRFERYRYVGEGYRRKSLCKLCCFTHHKREQN